MSARVLTGCLVLSAILAGIMLSGFYAAAVPHHGLEANPDAPAGECLACHDGSTAHNVSFCLVACNFRGPHSILRPYPPPGKEASYIPLETVLAAGVRFDNGRITCISCHNLRNPDRYHLIVDNNDSRLCYLCHLN